MKAIYESTLVHSRSSAASLSFLAGAGSVLLLWWLREQQRRRRDGWSTYLSSSDDLQLDNDNDDNSASQYCIYLDYNGTTPIAPHVRQAIMPFLTDHFGNPSSGHAYGARPRQAMERARVQLLTLLGRPKADPSSIWFTACGTESDNMAIQCALQANAHRWNNKKNDNNNNNNNNNNNTSLPLVLPHIVTSNIEHPAIEAYLQHLEAAHVCTVTYVPVQPNGRVLAADVMQACAAHADTTILVTLMWANNETGALQPVREVAEYCRARGILMHTDAAQAAGKVSVDLDTLGDADMVTLVGHKIGAPKGVACLYVRPGCLTEHGRSLPDGAAILLHGGGQEFGRRAGTPNVPYIVGFGAAAAYAAKHRTQAAKHMAAVRAYLLDQLQEQLGSHNVKVHGPADDHYRLPNTLSIGIKDIHSGQLLQAVANQVAASAGATCHSTDQVSSVLQAMRIAPAWARGTLRLSVGPTTSFQDVETAAHILVQQIKVLQMQARTTEK